jgi:electron transfer flavoprotein beta subunit
MKIICCLKTIIDPGIVAFDVVHEKLVHTYETLNPIDHFVLEEGLRLKEKHGGEVIAVSVASDTESTILKNALLCGADQALRLWDDQLLDVDTWVIAQVLKQGLADIGFDLILCGARSKDTGNQYMVSVLAHLLDVPAATGIIGLTVEGEQDIFVEKKLQRGGRETYSLNLPAVLGLEEGINEPRYVAPFSRTYREGLEKEIEFLKPDLDGLDMNQRTMTVRLAQARPRVKVGVDVSSLSMADKLKMMRGELGSKKELFEGSSQEAAQKIFERIRDFAAD